MNRVDTRGRSCPEPVLLTKKAVNSDTKQIEVLVDNTTAQENVTKFLKHNGFDNIKATPEGDDVLLSAKRA